MKMVRVCVCVCVFYYFSVYYIILCFVSIVKKLKYFFIM